MEVTAPSIQITDSLFDSFKATNPTATRNDFFEFLKTPSVERDIFLAKCKGEYVLMDELTIYKLK